MIGKKCWFKIGSHQMKVGVIIDYLYDGLLQIKELERGKIHISSVNEIILL